MRIKTNEGQAIEQVDQMIKNGHHLLKEMEKALSDYEKLPKSEKGGQADIKSKYSHLLYEWINKCIEELELIFEDYAPVAKFDYSAGNYVIEKNQHQIRDEAQKRIAILIEYYEKLSKDAEQELSYYPKNRTLRYNKKEISLGRKINNRSLLCKYMFDRPAKALVEKEDLIQFMFGEESCDKHINSIKHAYEDINKLTKENFGFNIFSSVGKTQLIRLQAPS